jgi:hypothetical protein
LVHRLLVGAVRTVLHGVRENETLKDLQVLTVTSGYLNYNREDTTADDNNAEEQRPAWAVALFSFESDGHRAQ